MVQAANEATERIGELACEDVDDDFCDVIELVKPPARN